MMSAGAMWQRVVLALLGLCLFAAGQDVLSADPGVKGSTLSACYNANSAKPKKPTTMPFVNCNACGEADICVLETSIKMDFCGGRTVEVKVKPDNRLVYSVCVHPTLPYPIFTKHRVPEKVGRLAWSRGDWKNMDVKNQKIYPGPWAISPTGKYINDYYYAAGHLVPYSLLSYENVLGQSTMLPINRLPQWQPLNNGPWKKLEQMIAKDYQDFVVYTGATFPVKPTMIWRSKKIGPFSTVPTPAPGFFWKVVVGTKKWQAYWAKNDTAKEPKWFEIPPPDTLKEQNFSGVLQQIMDDAGSGNRRISQSLPPPIEPAVFGAELKVTLSREGNGSPKSEMPPISYSLLFNPNNKGIDDRKIRHVTPYNKCPYLMQNIFYTRRSTVSPKGLAEKLSQIAEVGKSTEGVKALTPGDDVVCLFWLEFFK